MALTAYSEIRRMVHRHQILQPFRIPRTCWDAVRAGQRERCGEPRVSRRAAQGLACCCRTWRRRCLPAAVSSRASRTLAGRGAGTPPTTSRIELDRIIWPIHRAGWRTCLKRQFDEVKVEPVGAPGGVCGSLAIPSNCSLPTAFCSTAFCRRSPTHASSLRRQPRQPNAPLQSGGRDLGGLAARPKAARFRGNRALIFKAEIALAAPSDNRGYETMGLFAPVAPGVNRPD